MENSIYANYAYAFFDLVRDRELDAYSGAVKSIKEDFADNPEFLRLLSSYIIDKSELHRIVEEVYGKYSLPYLMDFMKVLVDNRRIAHFEEIAKCFVSLANEKLGIGEGIIYSSLKLDSEAVGRIESAFAKKLSKRVSLRNVVDPSLLGGVKVALEGKVYDGSVRNRLFELQKHLLSGGNNP
jgi:F-type H+-transporting ATPase subunit delta